VRPICTREEGGGKGGRDFYGGRDETCSVSTGKGGGGGLHLVQHLCLPVLLLRVPHDRLRPGQPAQRRRPPPGGVAAHRLRAPIEITRRRGCRRRRHRPPLQQRRLRLSKCSHGWSQSGSGVSKELFTRVESLVNKGRVRLQKCLNERSYRGMAGGLERMELARHGRTPLLETKSATPSRATRRGAARARVRALPRRAPWRPPWRVAPPRAWFSAAR
jgi:hypothetical protein